MKVTANEMLKRADQILAECHELMPHRESKLYMVHFYVSRRMTQAAGTAQPSTGKIKLSMAYFEDRGNFENEFRNVVTHEIAHIVSPPIYSKGRRSSHGPAWKATHRRLGGTGDRCHSLELATGYKRRETTRVQVSCPKCNQPMNLGPTQIKRHNRGLQYSHTKCPK